MTWVKLALLAVLVLVGWEAPASAEPEVPPSFELVTTVLDRGFVASARSLDGRCYYYEVSWKQRKDTGPFSFTSDCETAMPGFGDMTRLRPGETTTLTVVASRDKYGSNPVTRTVRFRPGEGFRPLDGETATEFRVTGTIELHDGARGLAPSNHRVFSIDKTYVVGDGVDVQAQIGRCIGGNEVGVLFSGEFHQGPGLELWLDYDWLFSETNNTRKNSDCFDSVAEDGSQRIRLSTADGHLANLQLVQSGRKSGNWFNLNLTITPTRR